MKRKRFLIIGFVLFLISACSVLEMRFDKKKWNEKDDMLYLYRERMVNDLMRNHLKMGMTYREVEELLGKSDYQDSTKNTISYEIMVDYDRDIDPVKGKNLNLGLGKDSTLKSFELKQWKN